MFSILCKLARGAQNQIKETPYFAEGFHTHVAGPGCSDPAAGCRIQHPKRQLQEPRGINAFATAVCHRHVASNQRGMHANSEAEPRMPWVQDLPEFNNMGVVLIACITRTGPISAWRKKRLAIGRRRKALARLPASCPYLVLVVCIIAISLPPERVVVSALSGNRR